jgi:hypothetical protein
VGSIDEYDLPPQVVLVWHGLNDAENLHEFLAADIEWGECDVRRDPLGRLVLRHDSFAARPSSDGEVLLALDAVLASLVEQGRNVKLDLKDGPDVIDDTLAALATHRLADDRVWFNGSFEVLREEGFRTLRAARPAAVVQCSVDFLRPLVLAAPDQARAVLSVIGDWGVDRISLRWQNDDLDTVLDRLRAWGHEVNLYGVPDLKSFLRAVMLLPNSVTADFNFPAWGYHGHGSGQQIDDSAAA